MSLVQSESVGQAMGMQLGTGAVVGTQTIHSRCHKQMYYSYEESRSLPMAVSRVGAAGNISCTSSQYWSVGLESRSIVHLKSCAKVMKLAADLFQLHHLERRIIR